MRDLIECEFPVPVNHDTPSGWMRAALIVVALLVGAAAVPQTAIAQRSGGGWHDRGGSHGDGWHGGRHRVGGRHVGGGRHPGGGQGNGWWWPALGAAGYDYSYGQASPLPAVEPPPNWREGEPPRHTNSETRFYVVGAQRSAVPEPFVHREGDPPEVSLCPPPHHRMTEDGCQPTGR